MRANGYRLRQQSHEDTVRALRKTLGRVDAAERPRPCRPLRKILAPIKFGVEELVAGAEVGLFPRSGNRCPRVGRVISIRRYSLAIALWGVSEIQTIELLDIAFFRLIGSHSWQERREVAERQRRGECAFA